MSDIAFSVIIKNDGIDDIIFKTIMLKGEKGNSVARVEKTSTSGLVDTYTIYLTDGTVGGTFNVTNGAPVNIDDSVTASDKTWSSSKLSGMIKSIDDSDVDADKLWSSQKIDSMIAQTETIENVAIASFSDGADNIPLKECEITIEPDLNGHTEANLVVCGKNLCPYIETGAINQTTGEETPNNDLKRTGFIRVKPNVIYYLSHFTSVNANTRLFYYDENKQYLRTETLTVFPNGQPKKMPIDTYYLRLQAYSYFYDYSNIQVEEGSTGSNYENYLGTTYNIPFGQTVYGGEGNAISGEFTKTFGFVEFDGSNDEDWHLSSTYDWNVYINIPTSKPLQFGDMLLCKAGNNVVPTTSSGYIEENKCNISTNRNFQIGILGTLGITTLEDWRTWLSLNHVIVAFTLDDPTSLSVSGITPKTISGMNNIYSDTGNINKLVYFKTGSEAVASIVEAYTPAILSGQVQSDWNENESDSKAYIKNKPTIPPAQVNADWNASSGVAEILNKPTIPVVDQTLNPSSSNAIANSAVANGLNGKANSTDLPFVKYQEIDVALDSTGEGTLFATNKYVVGIKDIPSDSLYVGYAVYFAGTLTKCKAISRQSVGFTSQSIVSTTRKIGVYYLDNIDTQ